MDKNDLDSISIFQNKPLIIIANIYYNIYLALNLNFNNISVFQYKIISAGIITY